MLKTEIQQTYVGVKTRFLRDDERLILSNEKEMPLVIEAAESKDIGFLQQFLAKNSDQIKNDMVKYGVVLLRGFDLKTDEDFEKSVLSIQGFRGISEAFMSEQGRIHVDNLKYVLHTNSVYKTGGTLYLGGFHTENYYTPDVPTYICFYCRKPSDVGGETGLINMEKVYAELPADIKEKLESNTFFVGKWLISEVADRYNISSDKIEKICQQYDLPIVGEGNDRFVLMYKPNVFIHPMTNKKSLGINLFEVEGLNEELRKYFRNDYKGSTWFWHRFVWNLPWVVFKSIELIYISIASFINSPKESLKILYNKIKSSKAASQQKSLPEFNHQRVGDCFDKNSVTELAKLMRKYYCSSLWQTGDILLVDNRTVAHAGMPGAGPRLIRALIGNPLDIKYSYMQPGTVKCQERMAETVGSAMLSAQ